MEVLWKRTVFAEFRAIRLKLRKQSVSTELRNSVQWRCECNESPTRGVVRFCSKNLWIVNYIYIPKWQERHLIESYGILLIFLWFRFFQSLKDSDPLKTMFGHLMNKDINFIKVSANLALILVSCLKKLVFFSGYFWSRVLFPTLFTI